MTKFVNIYSGSNSESQTSITRKDNILCGEAGNGESYLLEMINNTAPLLLPTGVSCEDLRTAVHDAKNQNCSDSFINEGFLSPYKFTIFMQLN